jgi:hypothetical protein
LGHHANRSGDTKGVTIRRQMTAGQGKRIHFMSTTLANLSVVQVLVLATPVLIPFIVDLVTRSDAPTWLKSTLALLLSCAAGAVNAAVVTNGEHWQQYLTGILYATVVAFVTHLTGASNPVQKATAGFGLDAGSHPSTAQPDVPPGPDKGAAGAVTPIQPAGPAAVEQVQAGPSSLPAPVVKTPPSVAITSSSSTDAGGVITLAISLDPTDYSRYLSQMLSVAATRVTGG